MTKKVLITGGDGFIAKSLNEALSPWYEIDRFARNKLDLLDSACVEALVKKKNYDVVIHTATYDAAPRFSIKDPSLVLQNNLKMFFNISRCADYFGKMIYYGSGAEFGRENWVPKMKESYFDQNVPTDPYGLSKYIMTKHTMASKNIYNLRLFGVFGEHDDWRYRFISNACLKSVLGKPISFRKNVFFDFLYIKDLVKITEWFIENSPSLKVFNTCSGTSIDYQTLAEKIIKLSGKDLDIILMNSGLGVEYSGDNTLLRDKIPDLTLTPIERSLQLMCEWSQANIGLIDEKLFEY